MNTSVLNESEVPGLDTREDRCSLLAVCDTDELTNLIDYMLEMGNLSTELQVVRPTYTGTVQFQVREPVCEERFLLADVIVTVAEVSLGETLGWAMRVGTDRKATLAAAIADALLESGHTEANGTIRTLLAATRRDLLEQRRERQAQLNKTIIEFEELD